ncbi:MAG: DUF4363 family protein [Clostridiales bacterium]|nr:DUF4363 family protein [Clostridiales bacterium]
MSRLYSCFALLLIAAAVCTAQIFVVHSAMDDVFELTETVLESSADKNTIYMKTEELYSKWESDKNKLCLFLDHDEIDAVSCLIYAVRQHCKNGNYGLVYSECAKMKVLIDAIDDTEIIKFENFF